MSHLQQESFHIIMMVPLLPRSAIFQLNEAKIIFHWGALIERAHYYAILAEEGRTIR